MPSTGIFTFCITTVFVCSFGVVGSVFFVSWAQAVRASATTKHIEMDNFITSNFIIEI
jgi:hypothetical protein